MVTTELKNLIIAYRTKGLAYNDIAEKLGVTAEYARTVYSRAGCADEQNEKPYPAGFCRQCGKPLDMTGDHRNRLFCDDKCRSEYHNRKALMTPYIRACEHCGHEFVAYGNPAKRFCSRECRTLAGRKG